jgi:hypothetical protein
MSTGHFLYAQPSPTITVCSGSVCLDSDTIEKASSYAALSCSMVAMDKAAQLFNMTTDQILAYDGKIPAEVHIEDKTAVEQLRLIQQLEDEDRQTIFKLIHKRFTNKKFKDFFQKTSLHCKSRKPDITAGL